MKEYLRHIKRRLVNKVILKLQYKIPMFKIHTFNAVGNPNSAQLQISEFLIYYNIGKSEAVKIFRKGYELMKFIEIVNQRQSRGTGRQVIKICFHTS